jgi:hypothetical protein
MKYEVSVPAKNRHVVEVIKRVDVPKPVMCFESAFPRVKLPAGPELASVKTTFATIAAYLLLKKMSQGAELTATGGRRSQQASWLRQVALPGASAAHEASIALHQMAQE